MNDIPESKNERLTMFGAVLAGGLASACCIGPLAVVLLGFGSASAYIAMEPYRPVFAAISLILLAWAGWRHWRGRKQCIAKRCPPKKPVLLWMLGGLSLLLLVSPSLIPLLIK